MWCATIIATKSLDQHLDLTAPVLQTTSPSYLLMASLDAAQAQASRMKAGGLALPLESIAAARGQLQSMPHINLVENTQGMQM